MNWKRPLTGALLSLVIAYAICAALIAWGHQTFFDDGENSRLRFQQVFPVVEGAAASVYGFQRVPITLVRAEVPSRETLTYRMVVTPLGGLALVGLAVVIGSALTLGRDRDEGAFTSSARLSVVFALICFAMSFVLRLRNISVPDDEFFGRPFTVSYRPSPVGAFAWPLIWSFVFGSLGAWIGRHGRRWRVELLAALERRTSTGAVAVGAAASGLMTGIALVLLAGVLTAAVGIGFHTKQAGDVLGSGTNISGIAEGVLIGLPHAVGAGLIGSMGIPARYSSADLERRGRQEVSAGILGGDSRSPLYGPSLGGVTIPRYALGGLLIAIAFTVVTGYRAAAGSGNDVPRAITSALAAAAVLTVVLWIVADLIGGTYEVRVFGLSEPSGSRGAIGPSPLLTGFMVPVWAGGGAVVGALLRVRVQREARVDATLQPQ